mmetsp:Transcript_46569/g.131666  ORF Transcript_46569/g.131666 Transcript_46569/m.131666 type:complete len:216 (+) Transcript_46569:652-1299(+)
MFSASAAASAAPPWRPSPSSWAMRNSKSLAARRCSSEGWKRRNWAEMWGGLPGAAPASAAAARCPRSASAASSASSAASSASARAAASAWACSRNSRGVPALSTGRSTSHLSSPSPRLGLRRPSRMRAAVCSSVSCARVAPSAVISASLGGASATAVCSSCPSTRFFCSASASLPASRSLSQAAPRWPLPAAATTASPGWLQLKAWVRPAALSIA